VNNAAPTPSGRLHPNTQIGQRLKHAGALDSLAGETVLITGGLPIMTLSTEPDPLARAAQ
jgi:hypothetical protein